MFGFFLGIAGTIFAVGATTILTGVVVAVISTFVPLSELAELVKIGTLFAFVLVAVGVLALRRTRPDLKRASVARAFRSYRCSPCST